MKAAGGSPYLNARLPEKWADKWWVFAENDPSYVQAGPFETEKAALDWWHWHAANRREARK